MTLIDGRVPVDVWAQLGQTLRYLHHEYLIIRGRSTWRDVPVTLLWPGGDKMATACFPSGLLPRVLPLLNDLPVQIERFPEPPTPAEFPITFQDGVTLYPDQQETLRHALAGRRGLLALGVNFGKTEVIAGVLAAWRDRPALVITPRRPLVQQTAQRLHAHLGEPIAILGTTPRPRRVTVTTIQTLHRRRATPPVQRLLQGTELLLVDEVHRVSPPSWYPVLLDCRAAWLRLGLSGTVREIKYPLAVEAFFGPVLHEVSDATLMAQGRSAQTTVLMPYAGNTTRENRDFKAVYQHGVVDNADRNQLLAQVAAVAAQAGCPALVCFYRLEHGRHLEALCRQHYPGKIVRLDGQTPLGLVEAAKAAAAAGQPGVYLIGIGLHEGSDLPGARVLINAAAWKSPQATSQKSGRIVRRKVTGGNWAVIVDPFDLGNRTLKAHAQARRRTYERRGYPVHICSVEGLAEHLLTLLNLAAPVGAA